MNLFNIEKLEKLIGRDYSDQNIKDHFDTFRKLYSERIVYSSPTEILKKADKINRMVKAQTSQQGHKDRKSIFWKGADKICNWITAFYCGAYQLRLEDLTQNHLKDLSQMVGQQSARYLKYQIIGLLRDREENYCSGVWSQEEMQLLRMIVELQKKPRNWRCVSFKLFQMSKEQFYRNSEDCKECWYDNLSPTIQRERWTIEEDIALLIECRNCNCNWKKIREQMGEKRTERKLKARFKEILKKFKLSGKESSQKQVISQALNLLKFYEDSRQQGQCLRGLQRYNESEQENRQSSNESEPDRQSNEQQRKYHQIRQSFQEPQIFVEQSEFDAEYQDKCLTEMMTRCEQMQKLIYGDQFMGQQSENKSTFLGSFPNYTIPDPSLLQDLSGEMVYQFDTEWLAMQEQVVIQQNSYPFSDD